MAPKPAVRGRSTPVRRILWYTLGLLLTAIPTGAAVGALGGVVQDLGARVPTAWGFLGWAAVAAAYALHEMRLVTLPHPQRSRQVPAGWRRKYQPRLVALGFGVLIGPGYLIFIRTTAFYLLNLAVLLAGSPWWGAVGWTLMALGRTASSWAALPSARRGELDRHLGRTLLLDNPARLLGGTALALLAGVAAAAVL